MSDLARRRDARDLWVSRSHFRAAGAAAILFGVLMFGLGYLVGRAGVGVRETPGYAGLTDAVPGRELVDLLAEVERGRYVHLSSAIDYPAWAEGEQGLPLPSSEASPAPSEVSAAVAAPSLAPPLPASDPVPLAPWTVGVARLSEASEAQTLRDHLRDEGLEAWTSVRRVDGVATYVVGVGGFAEQADAEAVALQVQTALVSAPSPPGVPQVVPTASW